MPANLDTTDGVTSFVSAHTMGWHQLGTLLENDFTAEDAMKHGNLGNWNVRKAPMLAELPGGEAIRVPGRNAVIRDNPVRKGQVDVLGDVGDSYRIIQNEEHAGLLNALVDESGAHFDTAGALNGGKQVFITMKMPGHILVGGDDLVENYIAAINSHDGSMAFTLMVTPIRIVCANTLNMAFSNHSHMFRVRHTSGAEAAMRGQARIALDMTFRYLDGFQQEAEQLINTTMTQAKFEEIIAKEFGAPEDAPGSTVTRADNKLQQMEELFADANTQDGIRDTAWAGLMALTEWADHFSPTRGEERDIARAQKSILDPSFKDRARRLMLAQV
jgi:phage/plasmid-like protein (TIGR03299 family)